MIFVKNSLMTIRRRSFFFLIGGISTIYNPDINVTYHRICYDSFAIFREGSGCNTDNFISYVVVHTNRTR